MDNPTSPAQPEIVSSTATLETADNGQRYMNRDLSWLEFNYRVLQEAKEKNLPVYERLKFLAIFSSNLDEFFRVRVASIQSVARLKKKKRKALGLQPQSLLESIYKRVEAQQEEFGEIFRESILPELEENGIHLLQAYPSDQSHIDFLETFFYEQVLPYLHPELLQKNKILHFLRDKAIYMMVRLLRKKGNSNGVGINYKSRYALIQIPVHYFNRFIQLPSIGDDHYIMFLDDVIRFNLDKVFPGYTVVECQSIKMSRNADLRIEEEIGKNLATQIRNSLNKRKVGSPARLLYDQSMSKPMLKYLIDTLNLSDTPDLPEDLARSFSIKKSEAIPGGRYHNFNDFFGFPNPKRPLLEASGWAPQPYPPFESENALFDLIREREHLLHFPYHSYEYVIQFLREASMDPYVEEIHTTQYRVASDSGFVSNLINAANNQKKVSVFVELKARFDEATNLETAEAMEKAGVQVNYSLPDPNLKVHAKIALVMRNEDGQQRNYAFLSTGNFNEKTAKIYADHGYFTSDPNITEELLKVFEYLEKGKLDYQFKHLLVAQFNMRQDFTAMIDREIEAVKAGATGYILVKVNNLEDKPMIDKLYQASQAGVKIDLIVRGICCLRPGVPGLSENIRIRRVVGKWLEHARVFLFYNHGQYDMYLGSADWMERNLSHRVEVVFPMRDPKLKQEVMHILYLQLHDTVKAVELDQNLRNVPIEKQASPDIHAQMDSYALIGENQLGKADNLFP